MEELKQGLGKYQGGIYIIERNEYSAYFWQKVMISIMFNQICYNGFYNTVYNGQWSSRWYITMNYGNSYEACR